jgi:RHS repeat-associated protein
MLAPAKPQTRVGVFDLAEPTRVGLPRRRSRGNRRKKSSARRRPASEPCFGPNGELLTKTDASGTTAYTYDSFGNLRNVTPPTGAAVDYVIDGLNRRVGRKVGGTLVQGLLYQNQLNAVAELDGSGNLVAQYLYGTKNNVPDVKTDGTGTYRILSDHLGSPRLVVNTADGTVVERMDFDEWGSVTADSAPSTAPFGFAGGLYEQSTALVRFGARDYDPKIGRWTIKDQSRFDGGQIALYAYANNDPVNSLDTNGMQYRPVPQPLPPGPQICVDYTPVNTRARELCCKYACIKAFGEMNQDFESCFMSCNPYPPDPPDPKCPAN